ncbi:MAG: D-alanyl-D-alanine carboxypeptidase [Oscillospiraceae bacterium]|jgi:D-alanyl-D-alanine carboxypeptidase (penicillin-binding protein 5/6)|nr:D-alanyl-D-alanine carboxypeptidase [Oscillospiraceae bacterium]
MGYPKKTKIFAAWLAAACVAALLLFGQAVPAGAAFNNLLRDVPNLSGVSEILLLESLDDGSVIFSQNDTVRTAPASLTKIVTAILTLEYCRNLEEPITVKPYCISMFYGTNSSNAGIRIGEVLTVEQLLYCMMVPSANEAAAILADYVAGSQEAFVAQMNSFVSRLGCKDTHFMNVHGMDEEGHYTTAKDIAAITRYALSRDFKGNALFEKICATRTYELPATNKNPRPRNLINTNKMMSRGYRDYFSADVSGVKTGTTKNAGDCVVTRASRGGFHYLCVVMRGDKVTLGADTYLKNTAFVDAKALLDWSFAHIKLRQVTDPAKAVAELPVEMARNVDHVQLMPAEALAAFVPEGVGSGSVLIEPIPDLTPQSVMAPVKKGQVIGKARILYAGEEFARVDLVAAEAVGRSAAMFLVSLAKQAVRSTLAKAMLAAVLIAGGIYLAVVFLQTRAKRRERQLRVLPNAERETRRR